MDSKKPKSVAPPADAAHLEKQFSKLDVDSTKNPYFLEATYKPSVLEATRKPSSSSTSTSTSRRTEPSFQPSSRQATERGQSTIGQKTTNETVLDKTARVKTENYQVGNMERTYLEGMVPKSKYDSSSSKGQQSYPATQPPIGRSMAPYSAKSILINPDDVTMASRQTKIASLAPKEKAKQEEWAQSMLQRNGSCPQGYAWARIKDGYQCNGGHHVISDELLQEGRGGMWAINDRHSPYKDRMGPYYAEASNPTLFLYAGPQPPPMFAPPAIGDNQLVLAHRISRPRGPFGSGMGSGFQGQSQFYNSPYSSRFGPGPSGI